MRKLTAVQDSEYLPSNEAQVDVLFAHWYEQQSGERVLTPLGRPSDEPDSLQRLQIQFVRHARRRDFRMTDLFSQ